MINTLFSHLKNYGLSDKEAKIYLTLLELDVATVFEVAKHSGINRSSAYVVLESLKNKGLVGISEDKKVRQYIPSSPEILLQSARSTARQFADIKEGIESILPSLKALHAGTKRRPIVKVFEGKNGLINLLEDGLNCKTKEMRVVSSLGKMFELLPEYLPGFFRKRAKRGIKMFGIHPIGDFATKFANFELPRNPLDEPIIIPAEQYKAPADFAIYDNKIAYMSAEDGGFGILIESDDMAQVMKSVFDLAYEEAKRLQQNIRSDYRPPTPAFQKKLL